MTDEASGERERLAERRRRWRVILVLALVYWSVIFLLDFIIQGPADQRLMVFVVGKASLALFAMLSTVALSAVLFRLRRFAFPFRALACVILTLVIAPIYCTIDYSVAAAIVHPEPMPLTSKFVIIMMLIGSLYYFGWASLSLALIYSFEAKDRERQLAAIREEALRAQMRALRYQVNPHFLFNTLNSIAGLVEEGASGRARSMLLGLSDFLRATLTIDPIQDIRLSEEIMLQREYLGIERERFSDRMELEIDVPVALGEALVPSFILQPLVENAMRHGVGEVAGDVRVAIHARRRGEVLVLMVENGMPADGSTSRKGAGIGLGNVAERLDVRFGDRASLDAGPAGPSLYRATVQLPWRTAA